MNLLLLSPGPCDNKITWSGTSMNLLNAFRNIETIEVSHVNMYSFIPFIHYCPVKILDLEINRVDHHPLGR